MTRPMKHLQNIKRKSEIGMYFDWRKIFC